MKKEFVKHIDEIIWDIFRDDQKAQGFKVTNSSINLPLKELQRAISRGGFTIGQLVHQSKIFDWSALTFDDITGSPYRALASRSQADISTYLSKDLKIPAPLISSNMECVTGPNLAITLASMGCAGVLHQFCSPLKQSKNVAKVKNHTIKPTTIDGRIYSPALDENNKLIVGAAIGVQEKNINRAELLIKEGVDFLVVDIAHGHSDQMINIVKELKNKYPKIPVVAGNVVTPKGAYELCEAGADVLKVGVGPGAACTTRMVTGYGVPQITAIYETSLIAKEYNVKIMADGGIKTSGDMVKALAAGADSIMCGSLFASTRESNDFEKRIVEYNSKTGLPKLLQYYGSASALAKQKQKRGRFDMPEGRDITISYTGLTKLVLAGFLTGIQSGISYAGRSRDTKKDLPASIERLRSKSRWTKQSSSGLYEANKGNSKL